jgi:hypothetical protein
MRYLVSRPPCLQEDEGRTQYCTDFETYEDAKAYVMCITENDTGYFRVSNYHINGEAIK